LSLTSKDVAEITRILEESSFDELYLEINGFKLTLKRTAANASSQPPRAEVTAPAGPAQTAAVAAPSPALDEAEVRSVVAPLLGTFYRAPKPGEPPFVEVGAQVEAETIIGIIEVMKLMNTVRAGVQGTVVDILARDGALVEYGEVLLRVRTSA
jgi:acetyl-CoA carboxylase biotin carboxyl carrier protein